MEENTIGIDNAPWWLPHSTVVLREDYTAADEAWVQSRIAKVSVQGSGSGASGDVSFGKGRGVLQIERMSMPGSIVAVQRRNGRVKTVKLPQEAEQLLAPDLVYIVGQIEALNEPIAPEEQESFLPSANGHSEVSLQRVK